MIGALTLPLDAVSAPQKAEKSVSTPYTQINAAAASSPITVHPLRGNLSMLEGSGGNITAFATPEGLFLVDAGIAVSQQKIQQALRRLSPGRLRYVVNTHWHWDHTDGDGWVRAEGADLIAHANTIKHLGETIRIAAWGHTFTPVAKASLPNVSMKGSKTIKFGGESVLLRTYPASHTDGDLSVYFPKADVLATGDTWWNGMYPFIDYAAGGSIDGMIKAANENVARVTDHTIVTPGHGPVGGRKDLIAFRDMLVDVRTRVAGLKAQGKTIDTIIAAKPTAAYDAKWGTSVISPELFTRLVYRGV
jgi:glyoxylase-like metal-dependent hydrolase (beta-lactamase superfamily II)